MTSGTVTSITSPVANPETIAGHLLALVPSSFLKWRIGCLRSIVSCWDNVSRISNDAKLFPHRPVIIVSLPRSCFCHVTQRSWGGVLRDETKTAARETSYGTVRCLLSFLFSSLCSFVYGVAEGVWKRSRALEVSISPPSSERVFIDESIVRNVLIIILLQYMS